VVCRTKPVHLSAWQFGILVAKCAISNLQRPQACWRMACSGSWAALDRQTSASLKLLTHSRQAPRAIQRWIRASPPWWLMLSVCVRNRVRICVNVPAAPPRPGGAHRSEQGAVYLQVTSGRERPHESHSPTERGRHRQRIPRPSPSRRLMSEEETWEPLPKIRGGRKTATQQGQPKQRQRAQVKRDWRQGLHCQVRKRILQKAGMGWRERRGGCRWKSTWRRA
jgi:hypothetical protein